jgi:hypothetical protein
MYCVIDTETTNNKKYGRLNHAYNKIITIGYKKCNSSPYTTKEEDFYIDDGIDLLIGHNIKYDLLMLWNDKYGRLARFFKQNGKIWDTQLVEYIITAQQTKYAALRRIAIEKYGCLPRRKQIEYHLFDQKQTLKELELQVSYLMEFENEEFLPEAEETKKEIERIAEIKCMEDIPIQYVKEDVKNDVIDTEQVYLKQLEIVKELGMEALVRTQMDGLLATTETEFNGFWTNKAKLLENKQQLEYNLKEKLKRLQILIKPYWEQSNYE